MPGDPERVPRYNPGPIGSIIMLVLTAGLVILFTWLGNHFTGRP